MASLVQNVCVFLARLELPAATLRDPDATSSRIVKEPLTVQSASSGKVTAAERDAKHYSLLQLSGLKVACVSDIE